MLKKHCLFFILFVMGIGHLFAQTLTIRVENCDIGKGYLMIGIFNDENDFPNSYYRGEKVAVSDRTMVISFHNLPVGQYAVSVYQDSNNNGKLDTGIFGIPTEKYGFSNGSRRPNFKQCLFNFNSDMTITIQIR